MKPKMVNVLINMILNLVWKITEKAHIHLNLGDNMNFDKDSEKAFSLYIFILRIVFVDPETGTSNIFRFYDFPCAEI